MRQATRIGRLRMIAGGLGVGAALASTPAFASADSSTEPFSWLDQVFSGLSVPAETAAPPDMQISISGMDLFPTAGNTAIATSSGGNIAIAIGNGANSNATGGFFDFTLADGTNSVANTAYGANLDTALAYGDNSYANVGLGAILDNATAIGAGSNAVVGIGASNDTAFADGTNSAANAGVGNYDRAYAVGDGSTSSVAGVGNHDFASAVGGGNATAGGFFTTALANGPNSNALSSGFFDTASVYGNADGQAYGIGDLASIFNTGSAFDQAIAGGGAPLSSNFDIAEIFGTGSTALAGDGGNWDLAAAFGDMLGANATGANFLFDILPSL